MTTTITKKVQNIFDRSRTDIQIALIDNLIWPILAGTILIFSILLPDIFLSIDNLEFLLYSSAALGAIVLAEAICLLSGHFDLSVGSIAGFSAMFTGLFLTSWFPGTPGSVGIIIILVVGGFIGLLNGWSVAKMGVNPFLQTLAFFIIFRGAVILLSTYSVTGLPETYTYVGKGQVADIPLAVFLIILVYVGLAMWLKYFRTGFAVYAVGGDKTSSSEAGISTDRIVILVYVISGVLSAFGGLLYTGFLGAATPSLAENNVFPAFAASVIGGISLFGGRGNVLGAFGGVLLLGTIQTGLVMLNVDPTIVQMVNGLILLAAILTYTRIEDYRQGLLTN